MKRTRGVYLIRHEPTGRCYVGGSDEIERRWASHQYNLGRGSHTVRDLQDDWSRDGADAFTWHIVEEVPHYGNQAPYCYAIDFAEQRWIDQLKAGPIRPYNSGLRVVSKSRMADEKLLTVAP